MIQPSALVAYPASSIHGVFSVPGDKSISHRSVMLASLAEGRSEITGCLLGDDVLRTIDCFQKLGVEITVRPRDEVVRVQGCGSRGLKPPSSALYAGNSGTCMRLLAGVLAGQPFRTLVSGDESLSHRPMRRIMEPLREMGASIGSRDGFPPLSIEGRRPLRSIDYKVPVASAQVKSAVLLAALFADGESVVEECAVTRDHTERMLQDFGVSVVATDRRIAVRPAPLAAHDLRVPGDLSSAAFFIVAALIAKEGEVTITNIGLNPTRTGVIDILRSMGADIQLKSVPDSGSEPVGDITVRSSRLKGIEIPKRLVSLAIDEFPILFVAAACSEGVTVISGAEELRVKESDRIKTMVDGINAIGGRAVDTPDGAIITGQPEGLEGGSVRTSFDHRVAMAFAIASLRSRSPVVVDEPSSIATSFPTFMRISNSCGLVLKEVAAQ